MSYSPAYRFHASNLAALPPLVKPLDRSLPLVYTVNIINTVNLVYGTNMSEQTRREKQRESNLVEIKEVARRQMAEVGASSLSLRAIAREMGMTAPALYRYYENRDALVTELIIDAYNALADTMIDAAEGQPKEAFAARLRAVASAYRKWAVDHPEDYKLIYGTPIPGYHAPPERTVEPAGRVQQAIGLILAEASWAGKIDFPAVYTNLPVDLQGPIDALLTSLPPNVPAAALTLTMVIWSIWHGLVWGEIVGHYPPGLADSGALFDLELAATLQRLKLETEELKTEI